jgi:hypothetical protein
MQHLPGGAEPDASREWLRFHRLRVPLEHGVHSVGSPGRFQASPGGTRGSPHAGCVRNQGVSGYSFQMSTAQRQFPSDSRRHTVTARPLVVTGYPSGPAIVTELVLSR